MLGQPSDNVLQGVNLAFFAITMLPIAFMTFVSFFRVRRDNDPARIAITYLRAMLPLAFLSLLMYTISGALVLIGFDSTGVDWRVLFRVYFHMGLLGDLFSRVVNLLLVMTLVEVGNGFLFCHTESRTLLQRVQVLQYAAIASCTILAVVALVLFGIMNALIAGYLSPDWNDDENLSKTVGRLYASFDILLFVWAGILMGFSTYVYNEVKHNSTLRDSSILFLYATTLNLFTHLYSLVYMSLLILAGFDISIPSKTYTAIMIASPILTEWVCAAIVAILVTIAVRKHNGLWTTAQTGTEEEIQPFLATVPSSAAVDEHSPGESISAASNWGAHRFGSDRFGRVLGTFLEPKRV